MARCFRVAMAVTGLLLNSGCRESSTPRSASAAVQRSARSEAEMRQELIDDYRFAHDKGDVERFLQLVCLEGAAPESLDAFLTGFEKDRGLKVVSARILPLRPGESLESTRQGTRWVPNLEPVAWLHIEFDEWNEIQRTPVSTRYPIGVQHGAYRIATPCPQ